MATSHRSSSLAPFFFFLLLLTFTPLPTLAARIGGGRVRPSFGGSSGGSYSRPSTRPATGYPATTAVGYPVNRPIRFSRPSTFPGAGYRRPYGGFFPGTVPLWIFGAGALYASGNNHALVDENGAPAACDLPSDSIDAYNVFNNFDAIVNGTVINNTAPGAAPSAEQLGTVVAEAQGPTTAAAPAAAAPAAEATGAGATTISEADRQAVLQAVETGQLNLDTINPALINQTYLLDQCASAATKAALTVAALASSIFVTIFLV